MNDQNIQTTKSTLSTNKKIKSTSIERFDSEEKRRIQAMRYEKVEKCEFHIHLRYSEIVFIHLQHIHSTVIGRMFSADTVLRRNLRMQVSFERLLLHIATKSYFFTSKRVNSCIIIFSGRRGKQRAGVYSGAERRKAVARFRLW